MTRLPSLTAAQVAGALKRGGFVERRQRGSHLLLIHPATDARVTVPMHTGDLPRGTVRAIVRQSGLTDQELLDLL